MQTAKRSNSRDCRRTCERVLRSVPAMVLAAAVLLGWQIMAPQPAAGTQSAPKTATAAASHSSPRHRTKISTPIPVATPEPVPAPPAPPPPKWPVNDTPSQPAVTWDSQGLRINATNASLRQILAQVSTATGAKVEGLGNDERVFGEYGPGQARDVLSQLLHGSSYNVLMIGDQGQGTPREIVLSARRAGGAVNESNSFAANRPSAQDTADEEAPEPEEPAPPPLNRMPMNQPPQGPQRTPQQVMQELMQRQQQMLNQQANPK